MKKRKELNDRTLEMMRKDKEKGLKLKDKIDKAYAEIKEIKEANEWISSVSDEFDKNATDEQKEEFYREFYKFFLEF